MFSKPLIRHFTRIPFDAETSLLTMDKSQQWSCTLIDISLNGALIALPDGWQGKAGDNYRLEIQLGSQHEDELRLHMEVKVVHMEHDHVGLQVEQMDVDTSSHLHRLIELNTGDTKVLERELAELVKIHHG
ncbi:MAG: PilZ domain-containing protein [Gammaproteobacteria bacterium]|nr:PilZ domain-containing protein [Gammaproteobacteria bacterium]MCW8924317.1 PilZ domain-containing protein [Gammaproteobacteria bacterium]